jgi:hypothetical protein
VDSKTKKANPSGVTTQKLVLIGVLAAVLVGVLYLQFGRSEKPKRTAGATPTARERPSSNRQSPRAAKKPAAVVTTAPRQWSSLKRWQSPNLAEVIAYDPFARPSLFPKPAPETATLVENTAATPEDLAKEQAALAAEEKQMQQQLEALRQQGVEVIIEGPHGPVAVIGGKEVRVGDEIDGFRVIAIESDYVQVDWTPN